MHARLVVALFVCLGIGPSRARADDFDDDFGAPKKAPPAAANAPGPASSSPQVATPSAAALSEADFEGTSPAKAAVTVQQTAAADATVGAVAVTEAGANGPAGAAEERPGYVHSSLTGLAGGVHTVSAGSSPVGTLRIALYGEFFRKNGFLATGDHHRSSGAVLSASFTPIDNLELAASLSSSVHRNRASEPALIQVIGDTSLFAKGYADVAPWATVGGDLEIALLNGVGGIGVAGSATSVGLRANSTFDLREIARPLPLLFRTSMRYLFDNSSQLVEGIENSRYASLNNARPKRDEYRHLVSNVERFALGINRTDSFTLSFGVEAPLAPSPTLRVSPMVEWAVALPVNRQGYDCLVSRTASERDSCLAGEGFSARSSTVTFGLRMQPHVRGLSLLLALDVATGGDKNFVRELAPNAPYRAFFGLTYAYDTRPPAPVVIVAAPVATPERVERGSIAGEVVDKETSLPIARALVHFEGTERSDLLCDANGKFTSYELEPGPHGLRVSADGYKDALCIGTLPAGGASTTLRCELESLPRVGGLRGHVAGPEGEAVNGARVQLSGPSALSLRSDAGGTFEAKELAQGTYDATIEADGYLLKTFRFTLDARAEAAPQVVLVRQPQKRLTELKEKSIAIKKQVQFVAASAQIRAESDALLAEVADVLLRNPQLLRVEVQGHTDDTGSVAANQELSQLRADSVRAWLVQAGVGPTRLNAVGYGSTRPLAPNITPINRARNRRVEFVIVEVRSQ